MLASHRPIPPKARSPSSTVSPRTADLSWLAEPNSQVKLYPVDQGELRLIPGVVSRDLPINWSRDPQRLLVANLTQIPTKVYRLSIANGQRELWLSLSPQDRPGLHSSSYLRMTSDGNSYAYSYQRLLSDLYWMDRPD
jgi:hypothetical protein